MKVLCLIDSLGPGGAQRQLVGLAVLLKRHGYDVTVLCYHDMRFYSDELLSKGVPYIYLKKAERSSMRFWHLARHVRKVKPDVVISYLETPSICACVSRLFNHQFKLIVSERNTTQKTGRNEIIRFRLFNVADYIVPNAYAQEAYIQKNFPKLTPKVITIPNFVDLNYFTPITGKKRRCKPEIIVVASIFASKNTFGFIDAVAALKERGHYFHISWYGKVDAHINYYNQCQEKIKRLGIEKYLELKEKTNKIRDRYHEADYFCLPSFFEGTPNVICEAMACGLPVVCSDVCDNSRYVACGENGFLFDPKETQSVVSAFEKLLALNDSEYTEYCKRSRAKAEVMLSIDSFVESYIKLIEK